MKKLLIVSFAVVLFSGCATQTYHMNRGSASLKKHEMQTFFVGGIGQEQKMNASAICGGAQKVAKVQSKISFLDGLLASITLGIYSPRTAMVYCIK